MGVDGKQEIYLEGYGEYTIYVWSDPMGSTNFGRTQVVYSVPYGRNEKLLWPPSAQSQVLVADIIMIIDNIYSVPSMCNDQGNDLVDIPPDAIIWHLSPPYSRPISEQMLQTCIL